MRIPGRDERAADSRYFVAAEDGGHLREQAGPFVERAVGTTWYETPGNAVDQAAATLCRLRRARAGEKGGPEYGDEAVRIVLGEASVPALVWLASRAISYMDESGFPELVEPYLEE